MDIVISIFITILVFSKKARDVFTIGFIKGIRDTHKKS